MTTNIRYQPCNACSRRSRRVTWIGKRVSPKCFEDLNAQPKGPVRNQGGFDE